MKKGLEEKLNTAKYLSLTEEERERMGSFLKSYQEIHPVRTGEHLKRGRSFAGFLGIFIRTAPAIALVVLLFGTGIVAAAQRALPGQFLYPVKTSTEEVRGAFMASGEAGARYEADRIERRLQEAERLVAQGAVSERAANNLQSGFEKHADSLEARLEKLRQDQAETVLEIETEFQSKARVYSQVLSALSVDGGRMREFANSLALRGGQLAQLPRVNASVGAEAEMETFTGSVDDDSSGTEQEGDGDESSQEMQPMTTEEGPAASGDAGQSTAEVESNIAPQAEEGRAGDQAKVRAIKNVAERKIEKLDDLLGNTQQLDDTKLYEVLQARHDRARSVFGEADALYDEQRLVRAEGGFKESLSISQDALTFFELADSVENPDVLISLLERVNSDSGRVIEELEGVIESGEEDEETTDEEDEEGGEESSSEDEPSESEEEASEENEGDQSGSDTNNTDTSGNEEEGEETEAESSGGIDVDVDVEAEGQVLPLSR